MAAAAGPAAIAVAVVTAAKQVQDAAVAAVRGGIQGVASAAAAMASTDTSPAAILDPLGQAVSQTSEKILGVNPVLGALGIVAGEAVSGIAKFTRALDQTATRYGEYSPEIAQAQAINEVQMTLGDLRRSQEAGPELARYLQAQGDLQQKFEDIKIKVLLKILPIVTAMGTLLEKLVPAGDAIGPALDAIAAPLTLMAGGMNAVINLLTDQNRPPVNDPTDLIINMQTGAPGPGPVLPPVQGL